MFNSKCLKSWRRRLINTTISVATKVQKIPGNRTLQRFQFTQSHQTKTVTRTHSHTTDVPFPYSPILAQSAKMLTSSSNKRERSPRSNCDQPRASRFHYFYVQTIVVATTGTATLSNAFTLTFYDRRLLVLQISFLLVENSFSYSIRKRLRSCFVNVFWVRFSQGS